MSAVSVRGVPPVGGIARDSRLSRYDLYLLLLPVPLLVGAVAGLTTAMPVPYGAGAGALPSALVLCYGLFRDAPTVAADALDRHGAAADD
ncbi:MAG: hypothetical protein ABEH40_04030 [Haloferacaceae archaeon]